MKYVNETMKKQTTLAFILSGLFAMTSCVVNDDHVSQPEGVMAYDAECADGICTSNQEYTAVCVENRDGYSECSDESAVNYTRTAADFRAYGERSPD